jgi:hypothetical protein
LKGKKKDVFTVTTENEVYKGNLLKGLYHGYGELETNNSIYKGNFEHGMRNGEGV